jgi:Domain of unknown function (DUF4190)
MARDDDDDEPRPKKPRGDDDEERPRARKRRDDEFDDSDDAPAPKRRKPAGTGGEGFATLVPFRNKFALFAYYCGIFAWIPVLCFLLGPIAMVLGIIGLFKARKHPKAHGTGHAIAGIVCGFLAPLAWVFAWYLIFEKMSRPDS